MTHTEHRVSGGCIRDRAYWNALHVAADKRAPFERHEPRRPFWRPLWEERELERRKAA
jgi:hypothetical protein